MACTTILVGKKASYDGSTMIARNDDSPSGVFTAKRMEVVSEKMQPRHYKSVISHCEMDLPDHPLRYTLMPNVDRKEGIWGASGINSENVSMTATETITTNPRVLGADPYVRLTKDEETGKEIKGGIGEEDFVVLVLPYIRSAKEGVLRLGKLLEEFGTYESNGIAFSDNDEIWYLETIGGHHWMAKRVPDDSYVVLPNQLGIDSFDFKDAFGEKKNHLCSLDLKEFVKKNHLDLTMGRKPFSPRLAFGSHDDSDHVYNTPRAWYMLRYFNGKTFSFDGENAKYTPLSDDLPWCLVPERKITVEDVKYILSSHYQGTVYDCYSKIKDEKMKGAYRPIGISRTSFMSINQIRGYLPKNRQAVEWVCFGSNAFNSVVPLYTNVSKIPEYFSNTTLNVKTDNFYWASRLIGALVDSHYQTCSIFVERYQNSLVSKAYQVLKEYDEGEKPLEEANRKLASIAENETNLCLKNVLYTASCHMINGYSRSDN